MRGSPIIIPGAERARAKTESFLSRGRSDHDEPRRHVFRSHSGRELKRPAIQGYACLYNEPFFKKDGYKIFASGCFTASIFQTTQIKSLWLDHDPSRVVGSEGLEFANTLDGLAFRFSLSEHHTGPQIQQYIDSSSKACVSVGCIIEASEERLVAGHKVQFITKAALREVSLVERGAVPRTFATLVDLDEVDDLWSEARKPSFRVQMAAANVCAGAARITKALRRLAG